MKNTEAKTHSTDQPVRQASSFFPGFGEGTFFPSSGENEQPFFSASHIQPKLKVGQPGDRFEEEADQMADFVMGQPDKQQLPPMVSPTPSSIVQNSCADCEQEKVLQRSSIGQDSGGTISPSVGTRLQNRKGQGKQLPPPVAQQMGQGFNTDFGAVRIHADQEASDLNDQLSARAFTYETDIYFASGEYDPGSASGKRLLAHELTHVVQQQGGEAPNLQKRRRSGQTRRAARAERRRLARQEQRWHQFSIRHPEEAEQIGEFDENFRALAILFENLLDEYADQGVRNSEAADIYERWLRRADQNYRNLFTAPDPLSPRKLFLWLRGVRNALHGQHRIVRAFQDEVPDDQGFQEVVERRTEVANSAMQLLGLPFIQSGRQEVEGGEIVPIEDPTAVEESTAAEEEVVLSDADRIYVRDIRRQMWPDGHGGWRFSEERLLGALRRFVRARAVQILNDQRTEIESRRNAMMREWRQASPEGQTAITGNVRRAKRTITQARALREQLEADITAAERLGRITAGLPDNYWETLEQITEPRGMTDYEGQPLPTVDYTRHMVTERYQAFRAGGGRGHEALMYALANEVIVTERQRQVRAITGYMNGIFHQMPFLRHITENNITITGNTVQHSVEQGYREAIEANSEARRAIFNIEPFSMAPAVEAALVRMPESIRPRVRQLIEAEQADEAALETLSGLGATLGIVLLALVPVVGPELAFAAGSAWALHEEAGMYFQEAVADSSVSPEEDNLGVARPGAFERWMNRLGPLVDIAFAGGGRIISSLRRPTQAAMMELRMARAEMEMAEAGIREAGVAGELVEGAGRNIPHVPAGAAGSADSVIDDALEAPMNTGPGAGATVDDALERVPTSEAAASSHIPPDIPPVQIRQTTEITNALGEPHGFTMLSDGRIIRCSDDCMELALSIRERSLALYDPEETQGMRYISTRLNGEAREIEHAATQLSSLPEAERAAAEAALLARARRLEMEMSDLELAFQQHGTILGSGDEGFFENIEVGHSAAYVDEAGTLGTATRVDADTWQIEARVRARARYPRGNYQAPSRSGLHFDEVGPEIGRPLDRLHPTGPDLFHETPHGILAGLAEINQGAQRIVERRIRGIIEDAADDVSMMTRVTVRRHQSTDFIRRADYELFAQRIDESRVLIHRERIDFENPRVHPDATEPDITVPWSVDNINDFLQPHAGGAVEEAAQRRLRDIRDPVARAMAENLTEEARDVITQLRSLRSEFSGSDELNASMTRTINYHIQELQLRIIQHTELDVIRDRLEAARNFLSATTD